MNQRESDEPNFYSILLVSAFVKSCLNTSVAAPLILQVKKKKKKTFFLSLRFKTKLMRLGFYFTISFLWHLK